LETIPVGGHGGWDYLSIDETNRRLYVSHETQVEVLDPDSTTVVGKITNTLSVHGIAIAPELGRGFTSSGAAATVTIFDLKALSPIAQVPTGKKPDAIVYDPATKRVFAMNGGSNSSTELPEKLERPKRRARLNWRAEVRESLQTSLQRNHCNDARRD
jgi:DNA-binding beta-propeller fold protein YncE